MKIYIVFGSIVLISAAFSPCSAEFNCDPELGYRENDCNNCRCYEKEIFMCTLKRCKTHENPDYTACEVGTSWTREDGEKCWCLKNLGTMCTSDGN